MPPKIKNIVAWQQAEMLMQPAFLRILDNIRKQLEASVWKGTYEDVLVWPEGTTEETKARVQQLRQQLSDASPETREEIEEALIRLPQPYPGYRLILQHQSQQFTLDLWELCYQVCFCNYNLVIVDPDNLEVEIDTSLIDETGNVDWNRLDEKAQQTVRQIFANLPII
ncbi:MAG TPA: hypothetical protein DDW76_28200 [Cyanobacteria bacterium UBA11369]|nr:hypothetical protein [Cyanobacteria bacterium UBA11369]